MGIYNLSENLNLNELLDKIFDRALEKKTPKKWNYQYKGILYLKNGDVVRNPNWHPIEWERCLRVAEHPNGNVYAYASVVLYSDYKKSYISLYNNKTKRATKFHKEVQGYDMKPAFSPNGKWLAFISTIDCGKHSLTGDILLAKYEESFDSEFISEIRNLTSNTPLKGVCRELQWLDCNTLLIEYPSEGYSKVCTLSLISNEIKFLGYLRLDPTEERGGNFIVSGFCFNGDVNLNIGFLKTGKVERKCYDTKDGIKSYYWFAHPNKKNRNGRTLLLCQGGPHQAWEPEMGIYHIPLLQHLGYSIVMPIVRGMPGITKEFDDQVRGKWGDECIQDYLSALEQAIIDFDLDEKNVALMGHSFGGFCAYSMNAQHPDRFRCFVVESGIFDMKRFWEECHKKNDTIVSEMCDGIINPDRDNIRENLFKKSPALLFEENKERIYKPILIIHGKEDTRVPINQAEEAESVFKKIGCECELKRYDGDGHNISKNVKDRYKTILTFLDKHML